MEFEIMANVNGCSTSNGVMRLRFWRILEAKDKTVSRQIVLIFVFFVLRGNVLIIMKLASESAQRSTRCSY